VDAPGRGGGFATGGQPSLRHVADVGGTTAGKVWARWARLCSGRDVRFVSGGAGSPPVALAATSGEPASSLLVTLVARSFPKYTDVTANRPRNNIQESLRDLGANTLYAAGEPIDPVTEAAGQPACKPIPGWTFTLGSGYVLGNPQHLSTVTGVNGSATTAASTPLLDRYGQPTGRRRRGR
jgi:hypothetical protein